MFSAEPSTFLVNNAAAAVAVPITEVSPQQQRVAFERNVIAPLDLAQAVVPGMRAAGAGWIVKTGRGSPPRRTSPAPAPGATKAALNRVTSGLAGDLDGSGIRVNAVGPRVAVMSEGLEAVVGDQLPRELFESLEEIVEAVVALCDCPPEVTGQVMASLDLIPTGA